VVVSSPQSDAEAAANAAPANKKTPAPAKK